MQTELKNYIRNMFASEGTPEWNSGYEGTIFYDKNLKKWITGVNTGWQIVDRPTVTTSEIIPINWVDPFEYPSNTILKNNYISTGVPMIDFKNVKSVIVDVASNWGGTPYTGISNIEFKLKGELIPITASNSVAYGDSYSVNYLPSFCFLTEGGSEIKTGGWSNRCWLVQSTTNKRIICVFNTPIAFDEIVVNNLHSSGGSVTQGAQAVKIKISSDAITNIVYNSIVTNSVEIFDGEFRQHIPIDSIDDEILTLKTSENDNLVNNSISLYSENESKTYGNYSMKIDTVISVSKNNTITKTFNPKLPIIGNKYLRFDTKALREGMNTEVNINTFLREDFYTKSIVLDIADNWADPAYNYMSLRSVEFIGEGNTIIPITTSDFVSYHTSMFDTNYSSEYVFNTTLSKIDSIDSTSWVSANGSTTNQRIICVLNTPTTIKDIIVNNGHHIGDRELTGIKNTKITLSTDTITNVTYNNLITNGIVVFDSEIRYHVHSNVADDDLLNTDIITQEQISKNITHYSSDNWQTESIDVSTLSGTLSTVSFKILNDDLENTIYIDNMYLTEQPIPINWVDSFEYPTNTIIRNNYISTTVAELGVLYLKSNHADGSTAITDYSPYGHTVTVYGTAHHEDYLRKLGISSLYFQPPGSFLSIANHPIFTFGTDDFTIDLWYCPQELNREQSLVCRHNATNGLHLTVNPNNTIKFEEKRSPIITLTSTSIVASNTWVHIAITRSGSLWSLFINGVREAYATDSNALYDAAIPFQIGRLATQTIYDLYGILDDIRIVRGRALWTSNFTPTNDFSSNIKTGPTAKPVIDVQTTTSGTYGNYAMKLIAPINTSDNHYVVKTFSPIIDFTSYNYLKFDTKASVVGNKLSINIGDYQVPTKSVILDITDNWGNVNYMAIRRVEFKQQDGSILTLTSSDFVAYATTTFSTYTPTMVFVTSGSKIDSWASQSWLSGQDMRTNQRLICVFNTPVVITGVVINNCHHIGTYLTAGIRNFKITLSTDAITSTVFNEAVNNSYTVFTGEIAQHVAANVIDNNELFLDLFNYKITKNIIHYDLDTWQTEYVNLTNVSSTANAISFKVLNDDLDNVVFIDNMCLEAREAVSDNLGVLLIRSDTTDGSTTFVDSSPSKHTITATLLCDHSTDQSKFGASSIHAQNSGGLIIGDSSDFSFDGDFTIDQWIYPTEGAGSVSLVNHSIVNKFHALYLDSSTNGKVLTDGLITITPIILTANTWQHYALVRSGTTLTVYIDGTAVRTATKSGTIGASTANYIAMSADAAHSGNGYIDELRIVKGTAEWTENFTPPTKHYRR